MLVGQGNEGSGCQDGRHRHALLASEISENRFLFHKELGLFHAGERHYFLLLFLMKMALSVCPVFL